MRENFSDLRNCQILSLDGVIGRLDDLLIEENDWDVRYLVVCVQNAVPVQNVLLSTVAVQSCDVANRSILTTLSSQQVVDCPPLKEDQPVSRQYEEALVEHFGWPVYWLGRAALLSNQTMHQLAGDTCPQSSDDPPLTLRSAKEICGYKIVANNGDAGTMADLGINMKSWKVDRATAAPGGWLPSESSTFSTLRIQRIDWSHRQISVDLRKEVLEPEQSNITPLLPIGLKTAKTSI